MSFEDLFLPLVLFCSTCLRYNHTILKPSFYLPNYYLQFYHKDIDLFSSMLSYLDKKDHGAIFHEYVFTAYCLINKF